MDIHEEDIDSISESEVIGHNPVSEQPTVDAQRSIFDRRFHLLTDSFGEICEKEGIDIAVLAALDPKIKRPIIFTRGNKYEVAKMLNRILIALREQITSEIG